MKRIKNFLRKALWVLVPSLLCMLVGANWWVNKRTQAHQTAELAQLPAWQVGLLLGTSEKLRNGQPNAYFEHRIAATVALYQSGRLQRLVISGDHGQLNYNEPEAMRQRLLQAGLPDSIIYLDYAGFRTYDSVYRMREIFGQRRFVVISQEFHNRRAVFITQGLGLEAFGYNAKDVTAYSGLKTRLRERLARVKVVIDMWLKPNPKFLGPPISID